MDIEIPYFMTNDNWYRYTDDGIELTDEGNAIPKVVDSYSEYIKQIEYAKANGVIL